MISQPAVWAARMFFNVFKSFPIFLKLTTLTIKITWLENIVDENGKGEGKLSESIRRCWKWALLCMVHLLRCFRSWPSVILPRFSKSRHKPSRWGISRLPCSLQVPRLLKLGSSFCLCSRLSLSSLHFNSQMWSLLLAAGSGQRQAPGGHLPIIQHHGSCLELWLPNSSNNNYDLLRISIPLS